MFLLSAVQDGNSLRRTVFDALDCSDGEWQVYDVPQLRLLGGRGHVLCGNSLSPQKDVA